MKPCEGNPTLGLLRQCPEAPSNLQDSVIYKKCATWLKLQVENQTAENSNDLTKKISEVTVSGRTRNCPLSWSFPSLLDHPSPTVYFKSQERNHKPKPFGELSARAPVKAIKRPLTSPKAYTACTLWNKHVCNMSMFWYVFLFPCSFHLSRTSNRESCLN